MKTIRWGIIGPGNIARSFAHDFQFVKHGKLVAVASSDASRAEQFASAYKLDRHYDSYERLYNDPEVDAIYVATPHNFHLPQSAAALKAGKAVLCEKPLTDNLENSQKLVKLSSSTGNYLLEGMWTWFLPAIRKAKEWYNNDAIGRIRHIQASFGFPFDYDPNHRCFSPALAGGVLLDMGIYNLAIAQLFLPDDPETIHVMARKAPTGVDSDVSLLISHAEATLTLNCSFDVKLPNWAHIIGEKGSIALPDFWRAKECLLYQGENVVDHFIDSRQGVGFNYEIDAASQDILNGKIESDVMDHKSSLRLAKLMDDVMKQF